MTYHRFLRVVSVLLIAVPVIAGAGPAPTAGQTVKVRKQEEQRLKKQDKAYRKQMKALARQYRKSASQAAKRGDDPNPLLEAADYFDAQAK